MGTKESYSCKLDGAVPIGKEETTAGGERAPGFSMAVRWGGEEPRAAEKLTTGGKREPGSVTSIKRGAAEAVLNRGQKLMVNTNQHVS